ncbi:hypothetical protein AC1031_010255 [Aphanomyces cochlioides]|nr:hypothetical protein AC1031_010255 [Aphanomyces cochlioides]
MHRNDTGDAYTATWSTEPTLHQRRRRGIFSRLGQYWCVTVPPKTQQELEAERWLFVIDLRRNRFWFSNGLLFQRWVLALLTLLTQAAIGSLYSFNTLAPYLDAYFGGNTNAIPVYLISTLSLGLAGAVSGPFLERSGPRASMMLGSAVFCVGLFLSQVAVAVKSLALLYIGFGVLTGIGHGVLLISSMSTLLKWFPDWRGLVTGVCVAGMGLGTAICNIFYSHLLESSPSKLGVAGAVGYIFVLTGGISLIILFLSVMVLRTPPPNFAVNGHDIHNIPLTAAPSPTRVQDEFLNVGMTLVNYAALEPRHTMLSTDKEYFQQVKALTLIQCIFSTDFLWLFIIFAANLAPTVLFLPQVNDAITIILRKRLEDASEFLSRMTLTTPIGVLVAPVLSDVVIRIFYANPAFARKMIFFVMIAMQAIMLGFLITKWTDLYSWAWYGVVICVGGGFGVIPSLVSDMFGVYNAGTMYGLIMVSRSIGAVVVGFILPSMPHTEDAIHIQLVAMFAFAAFAAVMMVFVRTNTMDRFFHGYQLTLFNKVVIQVPFRTSTAGSNLVKRRQITAATAAPNDAFFLMSPPCVSDMSILSPDSQEP